VNNILHVYGQGQWHEEVYIAGDRVALQLLANAINKAISSGTGECQSCVNDGEGFDVHIRLVNDQQMLDKLAVPYTNGVGEEKDKSAIWPWTLSLKRKEKEVEEFVAGKQKGGVVESTKEEPLARKWIFMAEIPNGEFCLDENGNEIDRDDAVCKCFIGTIVEASREAVRRGILHEDKHPSFLSCAITYESQGIVEQEGCP
jgi:hypothetical protein